MKLIFEKVIKVIWAFDLLSKLWHALNELWGGKREILFQDEGFEVDPEEIVWNTVKVEKFRGEDVGFGLREDDDILAEFSKEVLESHFL